MDDPILVMVLLLLLLLLVLEQMLLVLLDLLLDLLEVAEARQRIKDLRQTAGRSFIGHFRQSPRKWRLAQPRWHCNVAGL